MHCNFEFDYSGEKIDCWSQLWYHLDPRSTRGKRYFSVTQTHWWVSRWKNLGEIITNLQVSNIKCLKYIKCGWCPPTHLLDILRTSISSVCRFLHLTMLVSLLLILIKSLLRTRDSQVLLIHSIYQQILKGRHTIHMKNSLNWWKGEDELSRWKTVMVNWGEIEH